VGTQDGILVVNRALGYWHRTERGGVRHPDITDAHEQHLGAGGAGDAGDAGDAGRHGRCTGGIVRPIQWHEDTLHQFLPSSLPAPVSGLPLCCLRADSSRCTTTTSRSRALTACHLPRGHRATGSYLVSRLDHALGASHGGHGHTTLHHSEVTTSSGWPRPQALRSSKK
jgi:hypothetical protein